MKAAPSVRLMCTTFFQMCTTFLRLMALWS